jgi:Mg2+/citrate symporter
MGKQQLVLMTNWPGVDEERTPMEWHLLDVLVTLQAILLFGDLVGILHENAHF